MSNSHRIILAAGCVLLATFASVITLQAGEKEKRAAKAMAGKWDMAKSPHRFAVFLVLRQDDNVFPSYWAGMNHEGTFLIKAKEDFLSGELSAEIPSGFSVAITRAAGKQGMEKIVPGGVWMSDLKDRTFHIRFERFSNWKVTGFYNNKEDQGVTVDTQFEGKVIVDDRQATMKGSGTFRFSEKQTVFALSVKFDFKGADLGLEGKQAGVIHAELHTSSVISSEKPKVDVDQGLPDVFD